jgi:hypothetical protein
MVHNAASMWSGMFASYCAGLPGLAHEVWSRDLDIDLFFVLATKQCAHLKKVLTNGFSIPRW